MANEENPLLGPTTGWLEAHILGLVGDDDTGNVRTRSDAFHAEYTALLYRCLGYRLDAADWPGAVNTAERLLLLLHEADRRVSVMQATAAAEARNEDATRWMAETGCVSQAEAKAALDKLVDAAEAIRNE